jgi:hypothetical protein
LPGLDVESLGKEKRFTLGLRRAVTEREAGSEITKNE